MTASTAYKPIESQQAAPTQAPAHRSHQGWFALGVVCQDLNDTPAAIRAFTQALTWDPGLHEAAFNLGVAHQDMGAMEAALAAYARAWRLRPDSLGRIAQALVSPACGRLWLDPAGLVRALAARAGPECAAIHPGPG